MKGRSIEELKRLLLIELEEGKKNQCQLEWLLSNQTQKSRKVYQELIEEGKIKYYSILRGKDEDEGISWYEKT